MFVFWFLILLIVGLIAVAVSWAFGVKIYDGSKKITDSFNPNAESEDKE